MLYGSDGSQYIYEIDPVTWTSVRTIEVVDQNGKLVKEINEMEII
jgi:glutamine cyclotransferase